MKETSSTLIKGLDLLTVLAGRPNGLTLPELIEAVNQPRSNVVRLAQTLEIYGLVSRSGRRWFTTQAFHNWVWTDRYAHFRTRYRRILERVFHEFNELVLLGLHEGNGIIHIDYLESDQAVRVAPAPYTRHPLELTAMGKLTLSRRQDLLETIEDKALLSQLSTIQETGLSFNREESVPGMISIATYGFTNQPTDAVIAISWPAFRFTEQKAQQAFSFIRRIIDEMRSSDASC